MDNIGRWDFPLLQCYVCHWLKRVYKDYNWLERLGKPAWNVIKINGILKQIISSCNTEIKVNSRGSH